MAGVIKVGRCLRGNRQVPGCPSTGIRSSARMRTALAASQNSESSVERVKCIMCSEGEFEVVNSGSGER